MRVLVTGAGGMLGSALIPELARNGHQLVVTDGNVRDPRPWGFAGPTVSDLDVRSLYEVSNAVSEIKPQLIVHLAAVTSLEECEDDPELAFHINSMGTKFVALAAQYHEIPLAYISTAGVFDGTSEHPYTEFDSPNPINVYGKSKLEGEHFVEHLLDRYFIVRAGWMVGGGRRDHKFISHVTSQLRRGNKQIFAVGDKLGSPTYAPDFARCFVRLIESGSYGLYHMACRGSGSRFDVARHVLDVLGRSDVTLVETDSSHFRSQFPAPRPRSEILRNLALELQGMNSMRHWRDAVGEYVLMNFGDLAHRSDLLTVAPAG